MKNIKKYYSISEAVSYFWSHGTFLFLSSNLLPCPLPPASHWCRDVNDSRRTCLFSGLVAVYAVKLCPCWLCLRSVFSLTFPIFFPLPVRAAKSKLLLLLRAGLCKSNLCNRIAMRGTSVSPSALNALVRERSQVFRFTLLTPCLHCVSGRRREREGDMGEITEAVPVRMGLSIRECVHQKDSRSRSAAHTTNTGDDSAFCLDSNPLDLHQQNGPSQIKRSEHGSENT